MGSFRYSTARRIGLSLCTLVLLLAACCWTLRLALASHLSTQGSAQSLVAAIRLAPGDGALLTRYAAVADPAEAKRALQHAVALNPRDSSTWIQLGLSAESGRDFVLAERCYRQAARTSRQFQPCWTLANYFFRRGNGREFGIWAALALHMAYGDPTPLFQLCWRANPNPDMVLRAIPKRRDLLRQYLAFLVSEGRLEAAEQTSRRLLSQASSDDLPTLFTYCSRMVETGAPEPAMEIWNELCRQKAIPYQVLDPGRGSSLTNGGFDVAPSSRGFDWRILPWAGVLVAHIKQPACLRITFSGDQPESCETLTQLVPVVPGKTYKLALEYRTPEAQAATGLHWRVFDSATGAELTGASPQLSSEDWAHQELRFSAAPGTRVVRLALVYRRALGSTRFEGSLWLRQITLD